MGLINTQYARSLEGMILLWELSSEFFIEQAQVRLRSRLYDCASEAQDHKETRKAPEGKVLDYRNKFLYTSESGLSATPSLWLWL